MNYDMELPVELTGARGWTQKTDFRMVIITLDGFLSRRLNRRNTVTVVQKTAFCSIIIQQLFYRSYVLRFLPRCIKRSIVVADDQTGIKKLLVGFVLEEYNNQQKQVWKPAEVTTFLNFTDVSS